MFYVLENPVVNQKAKVLTFIMLTFKWGKPYPRKYQVWTMVKIKMMWEILDGVSRRREKHVTENHWSDI